ncbi:MAG: hypothetical protein KAJ12_13540 [Bacteroidetes bacterium]|nr:hypothetical protein [Bacteroidota bacterium]
MRNLLFLTLIIGIVAVGAGCSDEDDPVTVTPGTVSGTLTYPAPADGKAWAVVVDVDTDGDNGNVTYSQGTCGTGNSCDYTISNVPPGNYFVYALVRVVSGSDDPPQSGDYLGMYGGTFSNPPLSANVTVQSGGAVTCDITLETF